MSKKKNHLEEIIKTWPEQSDQTDPPPLQNPLLFSSISHQHATECINFIAATSGKLSGMTLFEAENFIKAIEMLKLFVSQNQAPPPLRPSA